MEKSEILKSFRTRLKDIRMRRGLNQEEFAKFIGVSKGSVGGWESEENQNLPTVKNLTKIAERLGFSKEYVLGRTDVEGKPQAYPEHREEKVSGMSSPEVDQAARDLEQIKEEDPEAFETVRRVITTYRTSLRRRKSNLTLPEQQEIEELARVSQAAAERAAGIVRVPQQSQGVDEPIAHKRGPKRGTAKRSNPPSARPKGDRN